MSPVNGLKCGSGEQRRRWCSQVDCSAVRANRVGYAHMALPKGWGKPFRGFTLVALGHAKKRDHPAPPFWAFCFLLSSRQPFICQAYWPHSSLDQILKKKILEH